MTANKQHDGISGAGEPLHPDVAALLADIQTAKIGGLSAGSVQEARAMLARLRKDRAGPLMHAVLDRTLETQGGTLKLRAYEPTPDPFVTLLYFHGGGWVVGDLETSDFAARHLAAATTARVVSVNYRLAPEHRFPAALNDAETALRWLAEWLGTQPADHRRIVAVGDSAGGNLASALALRMRDQEGPTISAQILFYPVVDCDFTTRSYREDADGGLLSTRDMQWCWAHYLPDATRRTDPFASPLRAASFSGLPPSFVATAALDPLRDEGRAYAERLRAAAVRVRIATTPELCTAFLHCRIGWRRRVNCCAIVQNFCLTKGCYRIVPMSA
ncbi:MAG: alpha/beta hydrolase [Rhizomicrobium sp.]